MKLAQDAYCKREGNRFLLGTGKMEKQVELTQDGQWLVRSLRLQQERRPLPMPPDPPCPSVPE